uniref:Uncharacterized protein n=1 Tax=Anguilla anguilla TaxID=7936 RepID=A0A0E9TS69_ANGAN
MESSNTKSPTRARTSERRQYYPGKRRINDYRMKLGD